MENNQEPIFIGINEAAKLMGVGRNLMLDLVKMDNFPAVKFKKQIRINKKQFVEWANNLTKVF
ncbi:MAG: helix-turn-helix domain-containing protein [Clostridia bacterium]|nr:helix-turn-helix domain-containing protein [Clostridia bacterium]MBP3503454.1 helix-turn-helix domain-containing protein [Clostridia bacterium]